MTTPARATDSRGGIAKVPAAPPVPRCQRTFRRLPKPLAAPDGISGITCPYCADSEVYEPVGDPDLILYARQAEVICIRDFGAPSDSAWPVAFWFGCQPECVREPDSRRYDIYLQRGSDPLQCRLQIGHEMFHRVCSQGRVFHWTHEMLACLVSVRILRESGLEEYARQTEYVYAQQAESLSFERMIAADPWGISGTGGGSVAYPGGYYGRAFVTGQALEAVAGPEPLAELARMAAKSVRKSGIFRWENWLSGLSPEKRAQTVQNTGITVARK